MRLLVACPECKRQYDATGRSVGSRFHCHCGAVILIEQPQGHDADVVRCSSCGGPRQEQAASCGFCRSDFTLHERDLQTVCPECLARVSDRARFCHHCGTGLVPELEAGTATEHACPACQDGTLLVSRRLGEEQATVLECGRCTGCWLGPEAFRQLAERARNQSLPPITFVGPARAVSGSDLPEDRSQRTFYRTCIVCGEFMNRKNYGESSGVIVDLCKDHGLWFDADELARVVAWLRAGGGRPGARRDEPERELAGRTARRRPILSEPDEPTSVSPLVIALSFLAGLIDW